MFLTHNKMAASHCLKEKLYVSSIDILQTEENAASHPLMFYKKNYSFPYPLKLWLCNNNNNEEL